MFGRELEMSESPSFKAIPETLVNGEQVPSQQEDAAAAAEEQTSFVNLDQEDSVTADKETQAKMQSVFQQVRRQIRSQVGMRASKSSILELIQRVRDTEMMGAQVNGEGSTEEKEPVEMLLDESKDQKDVKKGELCEIFEKKLEASQKALREEFEVQISQVRAEMQAYTDQALKDLCKMQSRQPPPLPLHPREHQESRGPDWKHRPLAPSSLASRRGRVLTRTMTTIIPKTCAPVLLGPRARSETLSSSKGESSQLVLRDPVLYKLGNEPCQSRKPLLPSAHPPVHKGKKTVRPKAKTWK